MRVDLIALFVRAITDNDENRLFLLLVTCDEGRFDPATAVMAKLRHVFAALSVSLPTLPVSCREVSHLSRLS